VELYLVHFFDVAGITSV